MSRCLIFCLPDMAIVLQIIEQSSPCEMAFEAAENLLITASKRQQIEKNVLFFAVQTN